MISNPTFKRTYNPNRYFRENKFRFATPEDRELPQFENIKSSLPAPFWENHTSTIDCYWKAWELAFRNLRKPTPENGFIANYIDTAYNDNLFMWDSAFILMFARYGSQAFNFQRTLDNFYCKQHPDGFICRELRGVNGHDCFQRFDPTATGPNVVPWSEWEYFANFGDGERLARVFPVLAAFHQWMRTYRTWPSGGYWASGWASGMDNQPRIDKKYNILFGHGHLTWIDTCMQQIFSAKLLLKMAEIIGRAAEMEDFRQEIDSLTPFVNEKMWDEKTAFYYDLKASGELSTVKSIGAFWALLADILPPNKLDEFLAHLGDPNEFNRPHRIPSLAADHPQYRPRGSYWLGGVWAPTNYMVLRGLNRIGRDGLAHEIAMNHLKNVVDVFERTGTVWENYAPEAAAPGMPAKKDFVGWTGLPPIAVLLENIFGLRPNVPEGNLLWDIRLTEKHGVSSYPFGREGKVDLLCEKRCSQGEKPVVYADSNVPLSLEIRWAGGSEVMSIEKNSTAR